MIVLPTVSGSGAVPARHSGLTVPVNVTPPYITGVTTDGELLTANTGTWYPVPNFTYQWNRNGQVVLGRTDGTYLLSAGDIGATISVTVTGYNASGTGQPITSATTAVIRAAALPNAVPVNTKLPSILGSQISGITLTADTGEWSAFPVPTFSYLWSANGTSTGITTASYGLTDADVGKTITVTVSATNTEGTVAATSVATGAIRPATPVGAFDIGPNVSNMEFGSGTDSYLVTIPTTMVDYWVARGMKKFRVPLSYSRLFLDATYPNAAPVESYMQAIKTLADYCATQGAAIMLDIHAFGARGVSQTLNSTLIDTVDLRDFNASDYTDLGTHTATGFTESATSAKEWRCRKDLTVSAGDVTFEATVGPGTGIGSACCRLIINTTIGNLGGDCLVDMATGAVIGKGAGVTVTVTPVTGGKWRIVLSVTGITGGVCQFYIQATDKKTYAGGVDYAYAGIVGNAPLVISAASVKNLSTQVVYTGIGAPTNPIQNYVNDWSKIITWLKANGSENGIYGYDLMNEPVNSSGGPDVWFNAQQAAIYAIRAAGSTKPLYIEGQPYSGARTFWSINPNLGSLYDPANNLIMSAHVYPDWNSSGTYYDIEEEWGKALEEGGGVVDANTLVNRIKPFVEGCKARGLRGHIGEIGAPKGDTRWLDSFYNAIVYCQQNNIEMSVWADGPAWGAYAYRCGVQDDGFQGEQQAPIDRALTLTSPKTYRLSCLARLPKDATTITVTVQHFGWLTSSKTITLSDTLFGGGAAGGSFDHSTVTLTAGYNPKATAVYTPVASKNILIAGVCSDGTWTNPAPAPTSSYVDLFTATEALGYTAGNILDIYERLYKSYTGPLIRLHRTSDDTELDFGRAAGTEFLDLTAIASWTVGGGTIRLVKIYSQANAWATSPYNLTQRQYVENGQPALALSDCPIWIQDDGDGFPAIQWVGTTYMDFYFPMINRDDTSVISILKHSGGGNALNWQFTTRFTAAPTFSASQDSASGSYDATTTFANKWCHIGVRRKRNDSAGTMGWGNGVKKFTAAALDKPIQVATDYREQCSVGYYRFTTTSGAWQGKFRQIITFDKALTEADYQAFWVAANARYSISAPPASAPISERTPEIVIDMKTQTATVNGSPVSIGTLLTGTLDTPNATTGTLFNASHSQNIVFAGALDAAIKSDLFTFRITMNNRTGGFNYIIMNKSASNQYAGIAISNGGWDFGMPGVSGSAGIDGGPDNITASTQYLFSYKKNGVCCTSVAGIFSGQGAVSGTQTLGTVYLGQPTSTEGGAFGINGRVEKIEVWTSYAVQDKIEGLNATYRTPPVPANYLPDWMLGFNYSGMDFGQTLFPDTSAYSQATLDLFRTRGFNLIRLPTLLSRWQNGGPGTTIDASYTAKVKAFIDIATAKGFHILLEDHSYGNYGPSGALSSSTQGNWIDAWSQIWAVFKSNTKVHYDPMNEPAAQPTLSGWVALQQAWVSAARDLGVTTVLTLTVTGYSNAGGWSWSNAGNAAGDALLSITDPLDNLVHQGHQYLNQDGSGANNMGSINRVDEAYSFVRRWSEWARRHGKRFLIGETGVMYSQGGYPDQAAEFQKYMAQLFDNRDVCWGITIWGGGPYWGDGYGYNIWPQNVGTSSQIEKWSVLEMSKYPGYTGRGNTDTTGYQVITDRLHMEYNADIYYPTYDSGNPANDTLQRRLCSRTRPTIGNADVSEFRLVYDGIRGDGAGGETPKIHGTGTSITFKVGVVFKNTPVGDKAIQVTFNGAPTKTIVSGDKTPTISDVITPQQFGWSAFPAGTPMWINYQEDQPYWGSGSNAGNPGCVYWIAGQEARPELDECVQLRKITDPDFTLLTTVTWPAGAVSRWMAITPRLIIGKFISPEISVMVLGDSLIHTNHGSGFSANGNSGNERSGLGDYDGYAAQGLHKVNGRTVPHAMWAKFGGNAGYQTGDVNSPVKGSYAKYFTHVICNHFHNNFVSDAQRGQINIDLIDYYNAKAGKNLKWTWILSTPETNSSDNWLTTENQSFSTAYRTSRDISDNTMKAAVGTKGVLGVVDFTPIWSPVDKNKWRIKTGAAKFYLLDATHHNQNMWALLGPALRQRVAALNYDGSTTATMTLGTEIAVGTIVGDARNAYQSNVRCDPTTNDKHVVTLKSLAADNDVTVYETSNAWVAGAQTAIANASDPDCGFDYNGNAYRCWVDKAASQTSVQRRAAGSTTWAAKVASAPLLDHPMLVADRGVDSFYRNRVYVIGRGAAGFVCSRSADNGATWTQASVSGTSKFNGGTALGPVVGFDGTIYVPYKSAPTSVTTNGVAQGTTSDFYVLRSTDGGQNFTSIPLYTTNPIPGGQFNYFACSNMVVTPSGRVHIVVPQAQNSGPTQHLYYTSDNSGSTWSTAVDLVGNMPTGWSAGSPCLIMNKSGVLLMQFYAQTGTSIALWAIASKTDGVTWSDPFQVSPSFAAPSVSSQPKNPGEAQVYGDASADGKFWAIWTDNRAGSDTYKIYVRPITVT